MSESSLKEKTTKGLLYGGLSNVIQQLLNFFFGIFLARILSPGDYGMVGMLTIFSVLVTTLQESGFTAALTNKPNATEKDYNAVFWFSSLMGLFFYLVLFFCAPLIADFYDTPSLIPLARFLFLGFLISGTGTAHYAILFRNLKVKEKAIADIVALIIAGGVGVVMAYNGMAYWGIATQNVLYITIITVLRWYFSPWRPSFHIDFRPIKDMIRFSTKILLSNIINQVNNNLFSVLLGRFYTKNEVGYYTQAHKWMTMGQMVIASTANAVAQPVFAQLTEQKERHNRIFLKLMSFVAFVSFPAMLGLAFVAKEFVFISIGAKWLPAVPLLQMLCVVGALAPITNLYVQAAISKGASGTVLWINLGFVILQLGVAFVMIHLGVLWLVFAYVVGCILQLCVWQMVASKKIGMSHKEVFRTLLTYLTPSLLAIAVATVVVGFIHNVYLLFIVKIVIVGTLYVGLLKFFHNPILDECIAFVACRLKRNKDR